MLRRDLQCVRFRLCDVTAVVIDFLGRGGLSDIGRSWRVFLQPARHGSLLVLLGEVHRVQLLLKLITLKGSHMLLQAPNRLLLVAANTSMYRFLLFLQELDLALE